MWRYKDSSFEIADRFGQEAYTHQYYQNYLAHHGILGQKWGVRRFQNRDGTLTAEGRARYGVGDAAQGAKTLTTTLNDYNRKQKRTSIVARISSVSPYATGAIGAASGALIGGPAASVAGAAIGAITGRDIAREVRTRAEIKQRNRFQDNDVKNSKIVIEKGQELKRVSIKEKEDKNERLYVAPTMSEVDVGFYEREWPKILKKIHGRDDVKVYQNTYKVDMSLVAPSLDERKATAQAIVNANKKMREEFAEKYALQQLRNERGLPGAKNIDDLMNINEKKLRSWYKDFDEGRAKKDSDRERVIKTDREQLKEKYDKLVKNMMKADNINMNADSNFSKFTSSIPTSPKMMNMYIKELKKQGYEAVYDDASMGLAPFIIFDQKYLKQTGSRRIA